MQIIPLDGTWTLERCSSGETWPAQVPGCAWSDLRRADVVPDFAYRDNEGYQQWIGDEDWAWERSFSLSADDLADLDGARLVCAGLDTLATVSINGVTVITADNMFRTWRADVASHLQVGENRIRVRCASVQPFLAAARAERELFEWNNYFPVYGSRGHLRKMACSFGWDWGPVLPTAGIYRSMAIALQRGARIDDLHIRQQHGADEVVLRCAWRADVAVACRVECRYQGAVVAAVDVPVGEQEATLVISEPARWWPLGYGAQPLYELVVTPASGAAVGKRIGLRSLELARVQDDIGETFTFIVNGCTIYAKGANWVPEQPLPGTISEAGIHRLLDDAVAANMNMLRVWGGGLYESDAFYDACDERGILIWQDCAFACGAYPLKDAAFQAQVAAEIADNAARLRHHPALALWCGNNELEQGIVSADNDFPWEEYLPFFDDLLPAWIAAHDPDTPYWPCSPHTPRGDRTQHWSDASGDTHHWSVFFGNQPIESQRSWRTRFMSEYGFQSMPDMKTIAAFTAPADRTLNSRILDYHQRSQVGNRIMLSYGADWLPQPRDFAETVRVSQLVQALCVRYAAEHLRRLQPINQGCLFWQINDVWPCPSWSSIDSFGRWKVLHYDMARAFAPVLVSLCEDEAAQTVAVHCSNQQPGNDRFTVRWQLCDTDGRELAAGSEERTIPMNSDACIATIDCAAYAAERRIEDLLVWAWAEQDGEICSRNLVSVVRPKHLSLAEPGIEATVGGDGERIWVDLRCRKPAMWVNLACADADAWWSDNDFHLHPDEPRRIELRRGPDRATLSAGLQVTSLADMMHAPRSGSLQTPAPGFRQWVKR